MAFWTETFLDKIRRDWLRRIEKIQYCANGVWYDAQITSKTVERDRLVILSQTTDNLTLTITSVRLIDTGGDIAGQLAENVVKLATQGVITRWEFPIYEAAK